MNYKNYVLGTLSQDAFLMVNKKLARVLGFVETGLLAELISTHQYVERENAFFEEGEKGPWFYLKQKTVEERLGIKRREHDTAIKNLVKFEVIFKKLLGLPAKTHYVINWVKIVEFLEKNEDEPLIQSGCTKRTNKDEQNVQTRMDETCIHTLKEKKELTKNNNKNKDKELVNKEPENLPEKKFNQKEHQAKFEKEFRESMANYIKERQKNPDNDYHGTEPYGNFLINVANEFYGAFSIGRWNKEQWNTLVQKLSLDIVRGNHGEIINHRRYIHGCLKNIAHRHDIKHGKIEERKPTEDLPLYDYWLDDIEE